MRISVVIDERVHVFIAEAGNLVSEWVVNPEDFRLEFKGGSRWQLSRSDDSIFIKNGPEVTW